MEKRLAFTLAEVLITLGIIGVVATITIPTLLQNSQDQQTVSGLKKTYSELSQAYTLAIQENGTPDTWGFYSPYDGTNSRPILKKLVPYLRILKDCTNGEQGCFPANTAYKSITGVDGGIIDDSDFPKLQLSDGTLIIAYAYDAQCNDSTEGPTPELQHVCGEYEVDINGFKRPNQWGKDMFAFYVTKYNGLIPIGSPAENYTFSQGCKVSGGDGWSCAAWVIYNENMDYLKCDNIDWGGPTKCN